MPPRLKFGQPGAIVKARLRNFMTYDDTCLRPGANLNMVIGPNGSGKSAIVCSIIVGLAGDVSLTGRANSIVDLVQRGCKWGSTEIELYNDKGRNYIIERKIIIQGCNEGKVEHKSEWRLNGNLVPKREIQELMGKLNIKVDNLCQFLPQDSVASFVKMTPGELLVKTLKAAGSNQLVDDLERLTSLTLEITTKTRQLETLKKASAENEINARRLETEVEELRAREQLIKKKAICSLKIHYIRYQEELTKCDTAKDKLKDQEESLRQARSEGDPYKEKINFYKLEEVKLSKLVESSSEESRRVEELVQRSKDSLDNKEQDCQQKFKEFQEKKEQERKRDQKIRMKQQELESYECRRDEIRGVDYTSEIESVISEMDASRLQLMHNKKSKDTVNSELSRLIMQSEDITNKRSGLQRIKEQKLSLLAHKKKDAGTVSQWLPKNLDKFERQVFQPMMCEINVKNLRDAPMIEHVINESDFYAFLCETDKDLRVLTETAQRTLRTRINMIMAPERSCEDFERQGSRVDYSKIRGFRGYLKDLVEAPEPIMRYLYGQYQFHRTPVFHDLSESDMKLVTESGCPRFFVREKCYQSSRSRYDNSNTTFSSNVHPKPRLLVHSLDRKQLEDLNKQLGQLMEQRVKLDESLKTLLEEGNECQRMFNEHKKRHIELVSKQGEKTRIETHIELLRKQIEGLKTETIDIEAEQSKFQEAIRVINKGMIRDLERLGKGVSTFAEIRERYCLNKLKCVLARRNHRIASRNYNDAMKLAESLEVEIRDSKKEVRRLVAKTEEAKKIAEEKITGFKNDRLDKSTRNKFNTLPQDTVEDLETYGHELRARIQGISVAGGDQLMNEFNRQNSELMDKRRQITTLEEGLKKDTDDQTQIKARFIPQLDNVIKVIDEHYRDFMRKLSYDGRVMLGRDTSNPDDFSKYGIDIMVKYRDREELIPLSSTRQSGGERSVATMIYMLALQTRTTVPFRVVDEINQGMDKDNERKVFELLVQVADESSSQYFLVSPKLLSGLNYGEQMQIHIVFNGPQLKYCFDELKVTPERGDEAYESDESSEIYYDTQ